MVFPSCKAPRIHRPRFGFPIFCSQVRPHSLPGSRLSGFRVPSFQGVPKFKGIQDIARSHRKIPILCKVRGGFQCLKRLPCGQGMTARFQGCKVPGYQGSNVASRFVPGSRVSFQASRFQEFLRASGDPRLHSCKISRTENQISKRIGIEWNNMINMKFDLPKQSCRKFNQMHLDL